MRSSLRRRVLRSGRISNITGIGPSGAGIEPSDFRNLSPVCVTPHISWKTTSHIPIRTLSDLADFGEDILTLVQECSNHLLQCPGLIWDEIPAFMKSRFLANATDTASTVSMIPTQPRPTCASEPSCKVSNTYNDGTCTMTGVLTIWPAREAQTQLSAMVFQLLQTGTYAIPFSGTEQHLQQSSMLRFL